MPHLLFPAAIGHSRFLRLSLLQFALASVDGIAADAATPSDLQVVPGFQVERIHRTEQNQGSWISLAVAPDGKLFASDQYGGIFRIAPPPPGSPEPARVESVNRDFYGAHGLLYAFGSLYVSANENRERSGLWRLRDLDGDGYFEDARRLVAISGSGEHGLHALRLSPDAQSLYLAAGNYSELPQQVHHSRPRAWGEDHLIPRIWDGSRRKLAPAGYIARMNPDGEAFELISIGFRNQYDFAFDGNGELFTFDSDMEPDQGLPWYVPTRINHVVSGSDFGWRAGSGRWPDHHVDSLPSVLDVGPGSPTGVIFGTGAKFPARYQRALYAADWTFGTLYAVHLSAEGASFRAEKEEFLAGKALPLTAVLINPHDGAMYLATGGRRTESLLYRIRYTGRDDVAAAAPIPPTPEAILRRRMEALHAPSPSPTALDQIWSQLGNADRFVRHAARVALEHQPVASWAEKALGEKNHRAAIESLVALARHARPDLQQQIVDALARISPAAFADDMMLGWLRAWQLTFTRLGEPNETLRARALNALRPLFPAKNHLVNRELAALLVYLKASDIVAALVPLLSVSEPATALVETGNAALLARNETYGPPVAEFARSQPDRQQIAYAYVLRSAKTGWTGQLRHEYFSWFARTHSWRGGANLSLFLQGMRKDALSQISDPTERAALAAVSEAPPAATTAAPILPRGPGRNYTLEEAIQIVGSRLADRDFARGKSFFTAAACSACHLLRGEGRAFGPDLSNAGRRYNIRDLLENIIEPSRVISDQHGSDRLELNNGEIVIGRVVAEEDGRYLVATNPYAPEQAIKVQRETVRSREPYGHSLMPRGLINHLNADELKDLVAYIISGGRPDDPMFSQR